MMIESFPEMTANLSEKTGLNDIDLQIIDGKDTFGHGDIAVPCLVFRNLVSVLWRGDIADTVTEQVDTQHQHEQGGSWNSNHPGLEEHHALAF